MARILVIEDDADIRTLLLLILQRAGHIVRGAPDGARGLELASELQLDLIVIDLELPVLNGWAMIRRLKERKSTRAIPVLAMTAHEYPSYRLQALLSGFDDILSKPFDLDDFVSSVTKLLRRRTSPGTDGESFAMLSS